MKHCEELYVKCGCNTVVNFLSFCAINAGYVIVTWFCSANELALFRQSSGPISVGETPVVYSSLFHTVINRNLVQSRCADTHLASISNRVRRRLAPICVQISGRFTANFIAIFALRTGIVLRTNILRRSA